MTFGRRHFLAMAMALPAQSLAGSAIAQTRLVWSVEQAQTALLADEIRLIDVRSRGEWRDTGVAKGAWLISMHEDRFPQRLFAAQKLAGGRTIALICATGGRSGSIMRALQKAGNTGYVDVSEGMLGSALGPGWIASGLPIVSIDEGLAALPDGLS